MAYEVRPYTNYHELNMDWVLEEMHKAVDAWKQSETYWTDAKTAFNEMEAAFNENTDYYRVQWPQFQNQINTQMQDYQARMDNMFNDFKGVMQAKQDAFEAETSANYAEFTTDTINEYQKFMTAQQNAYNAFVSTINEQWDSYKETMNTAFHDLTVEEAAARAKLEADVHAYVQNWFDSLNVQESVNAQLQAYLQSDEAKAYIASIINDEVLSGINAKIDKLTSGTGYILYINDNLNPERMANFSSSSDTYGPINGFNAKGVDIVNTKSTPDFLKTFYSFAYSDNVGVEKYAVSNIVNTKDTISNALRFYCSVKGHRYIIASGLVLYAVWGDTTPSVRSTGSLYIKGVKTNGVKLGIPAQDIRFVAPVGEKGVIFNITMDFRESVDIASLVINATSQPFDVSTFLKLYKGQDQIAEIPYTLETSDSAYTLTFEISVLTRYMNFVIEL